MTPTLIVSRHRPETAEDFETARYLSQKFNVSILDIPLLYDFPADSPIIERLRTQPEPAYFLVPLSLRSVKNMLNNLRIPFADVFETKESVQIPDGGIASGNVERIEESPNARWYPVIDVSKCSACLECVNFCMFGVYTIGGDSRPLVVQPDVCRNGCPACSRVCPSGAIMFPLYEDRVIAGYESPSAEDLNNLIDLVDKI
jgi:NAD-dependent dihydropyrimidine dehydrogenase PreA subunit